MQKHDHKQLGAMLLATAAILAVLLWLWLLVADIVTDDTPFAPPAAVTASNMAALLELHAAIVGESAVPCSPAQAHVLLWPLALPCGSGRSDAAG